jgi:hypothetical protein
MSIDKTTVFMLETRLLVSTQTLKDLVEELNQFAADKKVLPNQRVEEIKKIRQKIDKVGTEIDTINKEVKLLKDCQVN